MAQRGEARGRANPSGCGQQRSQLPHKGFEAALRRPISISCRLGRAKGIPDQLGAVSFHRSRPLLLHALDQERIAHGRFCDQVDRLPEQRLQALLQCEIGIGMVGRRRARVRLHSKATSACRAWIMGAGRVWTSCWTSGRAEMIFARRTPAPSRRHDALAHRRAGTWDATMTKGWWSSS